jgi:hypothetical protein
MSQAPPGRTSTLSGVAIPEGDGYAMISVQAFIALPLDQRVSLILEQRLRFYDEQGTLIPTVEGLKLLKKIRQASAPAIG